MSSAAEDDSNHHAVTIKLLFAAVIFVSGLGSTLCPLLLANKSEAFFSVGNMISCGVLLSAGLCHQLADSVGTLQDNEVLPFFLCGLTFLLFMTLEEAVHLFLAADHSGHAHTHTNGLMMPVDTMNSLTREGSSCRGSFVVAASIEEIAEEETKYQDQHSHTHDHETSPLKQRRRGSPNHSLRDFYQYRQTSASRISLFGEAAPRRQSIHHHHDEHISEHLHGSFLATLMLLMALSVHSVLAGVSMGIVQDTSIITSTAIAILAHKVFAGYALGSTIVAAEVSLDRHYLMPALIFSCSTPLGILIGIFYSTYDENRSSIGIVQSMVAGTFLYVAIMEVGMKELLICRHGAHDTLWMLTLTQKQLEAMKLIGMLVGFFAMSLLALYV